MRTPVRTNDTGSLPFALLQTLVGVTLSALLVPMTLTQLGSTRAEVRRVHALHAAQAGLDLALGHIRAANDGAGNGVRTRLPCGPLSGRVSVGGSARYQVTIDYLALDPWGQSDSWVTMNRIACVAGSGTFTIPAYALLRAEGTDDPSGDFGTVPSRSLRATYTFRTVNQNIAGGLVRVHRTATSNVDLCLDAGSTAPTTGTNLQMQPCDATSYRQKFAYNSNLTLVLVASRTSAALGMCLDAGTPHAVGQLVQFQPCAATTAPRQQWSLNDVANFEGTTDGQTLDGFCFNVQTPDIPGSFVILGSTGGGRCYGQIDNVQTFSPEPGVGAGAAGAGVGQLVNFDQFGRCLEVTEGDVAYGYLIVRPCKQAPDPANVAWNQKWTVPAIPTGSTSASGRITTNPGVTHCLQSPGSTAPGQYVQVVACAGAFTLPNQTWTVYGDTGSYSSSYRIMDNAGFCLTPTDPDANPPDLYPQGDRISKVVVAPCGGSAAQKWNALLQPAPLKDVGER